MKYEQGDYLLMFLNQEEVEEFLAVFKGEVLVRQYLGDPNDIVVRGDLGEEVDDLDVTYIQAEWYNGGFTLTEHVIADQLSNG